MLTLYLVCLIIGGALVALSIFAGGDVDMDTDVGTEVEIGAGGRVGVMARWMSMRNAVFFAAFFGLTGTLFTLLGIASLLTVIFATAIGALAAGSVHYLMLFLGNTETGALAGPSALEGALAEVLVDIDEARNGKVAVHQSDRTIQLVARVHEEADARRFRVGDRVVIVDVENGIAHVAGTAFLA